MTVTTDHVELAEQIDNARLAPREDATRIRERIEFILTHYPILSASMLQISIGPNMSPRLWRPVLQEMINEGVVVRKEEPTTSNIGQFRTLVKISLAPPVAAPAEAELQQVQEPIWP
jgi:hypothetical protein